MIDVFPKSIFCLLIRIDSPGKINQWEVLLINVFYRNKKRNLFLGKLKLSSIFGKYKSQF